MLLFIQPVADAKLCGTWLIPLVADEKCYGLLFIQTEADAKFYGIWLKQSVADATFIISFIRATSSRCNIFWRLYFFLKEMESLSHIKNF